MRSLWVLLVVAWAACAQQYTDIPFVPTATNVVDAMLDLAAIRPSDVLVDLGSGDGRIVIAAAKRYGIRAIGVEIDPELVKRSQQTAAQEGVADKTRFVAADLFQFDLRQATVVTTFLTPGVNLRLRPKLWSELKPGTRVVTHRFDMGNWAPVRSVKVDDDQAFLFVVPERAPAAAAVSRSVGSFDQLAALFAYDYGAPLNVVIDRPELASSIRVMPMTYNGARGPVSATLVEPVRSGRYPAVIYAHDYGKRDEFLAEAVLLARSATPAISLLIDSPAERPVGWRRNFNSLADNDNDREIHIQAIVDIRRAVDLLAQRPDVRSVAFVGHGYGANWGAVLGSIEKRVRAFVLIAGYPALSELVQSEDPEWANMRYALGAERVARYQASIAAVDPIQYLPHWMGAPVLLQFGRFDTFVTHAMSERLKQALPREQVLVYDAGHSVNDPKAMTDRFAFLARSLQLK